jgi:hypothetical protein
MNKKKIGELGCERKRKFEKFWAQNATKSAENECKMNENSRKLSKWME